MTCYKEVVSLEDLSLRIVYFLIKKIIKSRMKEEFTDETFTHNLKMVVQQVPPNLHDKLAEIHLNKIKKLFYEGEWVRISEMHELEYFVTDNECNFICACESDSYVSDYSIESSDSYDSDYSDISYVPEYCAKCDQVYLDISLKVICLLKIKKIELCESDYPLHLMNKLIGLLDKMYFIKSFSIYDYWNVNGRLLRSNLLKTAASWSNLTIFHCEEFCTDEILILVCKNCELLQDVNLRHCLDLKKPIEPLLICKNLVKVNLECNGLDSEAFLKLLSETKSNNLIRVDGIDDVLDDILDELEKIKSMQTFKLQYLRTFQHRFEKKKKYNNLIKKYFPSLTKIIFRQWYRCLNPESIVDFSSFFKNVAPSCLAIESKCPIPS